MVLLLTAVPLRAAYAENAPSLKFKTMDMQINPEYDTTDVLIHFDWVLTNTGQDPYNGEIKFHAPKGATNQVHICEAEGSNKHAYCAPYKVESTADYDTYIWKLRNPIKPGESYPIYIEYYYNPIKGGPDKTINFLYHPSYPVEQLNLSVGQPLRSTNFKLDPAPSDGQSAAEGITYYNYKFKDLPAEKPVSLKIAYTKTDNKPSVTPRSNTGSGSGTAGVSANATVLVLGVALVGIFGFFIFYALRTKPVAPKKRYGPDPSAAARRPVQGRPVSAGGGPGVGKASSSGSKVSGGPKPKVSGGAGTTPNSFKTAPVKSGGSSPERKLARQQLLEGKISEETYRQIIAELEEEGK